MSQSATSAALSVALRDTTVARYEELKEAIADAARAVIALRAAEDLLDVIRAADAYSCAAETLSEKAAETHKHADAALVTAMTESGAPAIRNAGWTLSTRQNQQTVDIIDRKAVPERYLIPAEPKIDRAAVIRHLKHHPENWAVLKDGATSLVRRPIP